MKKIKRSIALVMTVIMLLSSWVWVAPTEAEAAAGDYYIKISWNVSSSGNFEANYEGKTETNDTVGFTITYKTNNGSGNENRFNIDLKSELKSTGNKTTTKIIGGFPTEFYASLDDNSLGLGGSSIMTVNKIEIGASSSSDLYTLWEGIAQLDSTNQHKAITISPTASTGNDSDYAYVKDTIKNQDRLAELDM